MPAPSSPLQDAIDRLIKREPGWEKFKRPPDKGGRPGAVATGRPSATGGSGQQVTLEELDASLREYWGAKILTSSDGLFTIEVEPLKKLRLKDGSDFLFAEPPA